MKQKISITGTKTIMVESARYYDDSIPKEKIELKLKL